MPKWGANKDGEVYQELTLLAAYDPATTLYAKLENSDQLNLLIEFESGAADIKIMVGFGWNEDPNNKTLATKRFFEETADDGSGNLSQREFTIAAADAGKFFRLSIPVAIAENMARVQFKGAADKIKVAFTTSNPKSPFNLA